jgi:hypothetical protein
MYFLWDGKTNVFFFINIGSGAARGKRWSGRQKQRVNDHP